MNESIQIEELEPKDFGFVDWDDLDDEEDKYGVFDYSEVRGR